MRLPAKADTVEQAEAMIAPLATEVPGASVTSCSRSTTRRWKSPGSRLLLASRATSRLCESLTGGSVGLLVTPPRSASKVFVGSAVVYTAEAKRRVLGVSRETIEGPGVVDRECALEMAAGARRLYGADVAVSLTGAGSDPHDGAEPGTV